MPNSFLGNAELCFLCTLIVDSFNEDSISNNCRDNPSFLGLRGRKGLWGLVSGGTPVHADKHTPMPARSKRVFCVATGKVLRLRSGIRTAILDSMTPSIEELYPDFDEDELRRAEENLKQYAALLLRMYERMKADGSLEKLSKQRK